MSCTHHAVIRALNLTGLGNRPVLTPFHHVLRLTGIGPCGAMIAEIRTNPVDGRDSGKGRELESFMKIILAVNAYRSQLRDTDLRR
jgi:hypothetical protein